jgi:hypothetical protein
MGEELDKDSHLKAVRSNTPYPSVEEYMDTYFRLLRVECFSAIQKVKRVDNVSPKAVFPTLRALIIFRKKTCITRSRFNL